MSDLFTAQHDARMRAYYNRRAPEYDEWYLRQGRFVDRPETARWHAELAQLRDRVGNFGSGAVLELAAGTGWWTQHLARRAAVTVVDYSPAMLAQLAKRLTRQGLCAKYIRADVYALPLSAASFDCCFFGFWLSHVPYARLTAFLHELRRVLRHRARVLVVDSAPTEPDQPPGVELLIERILNDGSQHTVLKILHTPATMAAALAPLGRVLDAWHTGMFFTGALVELS